VDERCELHPDSYRDLEIEALACGQTKT